MIMDLSKNTVVSGLEGSKKSRSTFKEISKNTTQNEVALFVYKNYDLMESQIRSWSKSFKINRNEFCICGTNTEYERALASYTNPKEPRYMPTRARFIFCTQAVVQRNFHRKFYSSVNCPKRFKYIVVDEFDFTNGLVPTLDYQIGKISDPKLKGVTEINLMKWVLENYTHEDYLDIVKEKFLHRKNFFLANWIRSSDCPIIFLTSEVLAKKLLMAAGFSNIHLDSPDYKDCLINVWASKSINRNFFYAMNQNMAWGKLLKKYDAIISDNVRSFKDPKHEEALQIINHTSARGSNELIGKSILTIMSHIPNQSIAEVCDAFKAFGKELTFEEVYTLFYRDRLCQAVGRTLGNRGGKVTDLIVHQDIMDEILKLEDFPYSFNTDWKFELDNLEQILEDAKIKSKKREEKISNAKKTVEVVTYGMLDDLFVKRPGYHIDVRDLPNYLENYNVKSLNGQKTLRATKIAKYFGTTVKNKRINGECVRCIIDLHYAQKVA